MELGNWKLKHAAVLADKTKAEEAMNAIKEEEKKVRSALNPSILLICSPLHSFILTRRTPTPLVATPVAE